MNYLGHSHCTGTRVSIFSGMKIVRYVLLKDTGKEFPLEFDASFISRLGHLLGRQEGTKRGGLINMTASLCICVTPSQCSKVEGLHLHFFFLYHHGE